MKLTVKNDHWILKSDTQEYRLNATSVPLDAIVKAIAELYPGIMPLEIDTNISRNHWFGSRLLEAAIEKTPVDIGLLSDEFQFQESRTCHRCQGEAYYNASMKHWQCPECLLHESFIDKHRYFRRPRLGRNERARRREYFEKR